MNIDANQRAPTDTYVDSRWGRKHVRPHKRVRGAQPSRSGFAARSTELHRLL